MRPLYTDYTITSQSSWGTDPDLPLGRPATNLPNGLIFQGVAGSIEFRNNQFTTWPSTNFYLADPTNVGQATFHPVWVVPPNTAVNDQWYARYRVPPTNVNLVQNLISTTAFDFVGTNSLGTVNAVKLTSNTAPAYVQPHSAASTSPPGFSPSGRVERTLMLTNMLGRLNGVLEVAFGQTSLDLRSNLLVTVRAAIHNTDRSGNPGSFAMPQVPIFLTGQLQLPGGGVRTLPTLVSAGSAADGTVQFVVPLPSPTEFCQLQASAYTLATNQTAWAVL